MKKEELSKLVKQMQTLDLTDEEREKIGGTFAKLECGNTKYELKGEGKNVVLVHGYATPYFIYDKLFEGFVAAGYKTLRYDLLGRGYSERVDKDYTPELFAEQLNQITKKVFGDEKFILVGTSMGGAICATFTAKHSERVEKVVFLAPAGMDSFRPPLYMKICKIKGLGEFVFYNVAGKILLTKCASEMYYSDKETQDEYMRKFASASKYKYFLRSTLSSLRNTILKTKEVTNSYKTISEFGIPTLCIWGTIDKTMPYYQSARFREVCPNAKLITYENSGHIFLYDEGEKTLQDVLNFVSEQ